MTLPDLIILALATYRLTILITEDMCPFDVCFRARDRLRPYITGIECFFCMSVWSTGFIVVLWQFFPLLVELLAIAGCALLLWQGIGRENDYTDIDPA